MVLIPDPSGSTGRMTLPDRSEIALDLGVVIGPGAGRITGPIRTTSQLRT